MHSLFTPVDTLDATTYLHSVNHPNSSFDLQWLMPVTGLADNGKSVEPPGFDQSYGLYLTISASGLNNPAPGVTKLFNTMNVTLWADPKNDLGTPNSDFRRRVSLRLDSQRHCFGDRHLGIGNTVG